MFDNFGLGEFFFLALLALLFFGPERLPQIGAQLGRWIARLTQYSKAFMDEWREEALAIHEAVEEVRGIRDEIAAARAEISSTLDTAREDLTDGIDSAKEAVTGARMDVTSRIRQGQQQAAEDLERMAREERRETSPDETGEDAAIARTQQILDELKDRRTATPPVQEQESPEAEATEEDEWQTVRQLIDEGTAPALRSPEQEPSLEESEETAPKDTTVASPVESEVATENEEVAVGEAPAPPTENAFQRSQRILDDLKKRRAGTKEEETAGEETDAEDDASVPTVLSEQAPQPPKESAFDRSQRILDDLKRRRAGTKQETASAEETAAPVEDLEGTAEEVPEPPKETAFDRAQKVLDDLAARRRARQTDQEKEPLPVETRHPSPEFDELAAQVVHLRDEIAFLRRELEDLRALATQQAAGQDVQPTSGEVSVEEAA